MQSTKLFDAKEIAPRRRQQSLLRVLIVSILAPGVGHFLVGRARAGVILIGIIFLSSIAATAAAFFEMTHTNWILVRAGVVLGLFSIVDATLLRAESNDGRSWGQRDRPRLAATLDLVAYGVSPWRRGQKGLAGLAIVFGLVVHLFLGAQSLPLRILSEVLVAAWATWSWRIAKEEALLQHVRVETNFDQLLSGEERKEGDVPERRSPPRDRTPGWVLPTLTALVAFASLGMLGASTIAANIEQSMRIDRSRVVSMEPFFRNPNYGVALEMNAPGWTFLTPADNQILRARHVTDGVSLDLSVRPRIPLFADDRTAALGAVGQALLEGTLLNVVDEGPRTVGGRPGYYLRTEGRKGSRPIIVEIWTTGRGWREYVLQVRRDPRHEDFAAQEIAFLLDHLSIENGRPDLLEPPSVDAR